MSKVYLICGKICSGKTTYAKKLCKVNNAILLSVDEIMLSLFDQCCGEKLHQEYERRIKDYLFTKSLEITEKGFDVVLDWGFWTKEERNSVKDFYKSRDIECELHYIEISDETWKYRLNKRNRAVLANETSAYYVDENLAVKFASIFEIPSEEEIDVIYKGDINE